MQIDKGLMEATQRLINANEGFVATKQGLIDANNRGMDTIVTFIDRIDNIIKHTPEHADRAWKDFVGLYRTSLVRAEISIARYVADQPFFVSLKEIIHSEIDRCILEQQATDPEFDEYWEELSSMEEFTGWYIPLMAIACILMLVFEILVAGFCHSRLGGR